MSKAMSAKATDAASEIANKIPTPSIPAEIEEAADNSAVRKAASGTLWSIAVKLVSFLCTQQAFRLLDNNIAALGKATIQLELLLTTVLFVSREGFRLSLTRDIRKENWNVAWLSVPVSFFCTTVALVWHLRFAANDADYRIGGILYCVAALIEGMGEPAALHSLRQMEVATRVSAEGIASLCKTLTTVVALRLWLPEGPVFSFGVAQLVYAIVYTGFLYSKTASQLTFGWEGIMDGNTCYLTLLFTVQGLFKHFLTEGDRIVLTTLAGGYDQGIYAMGSAYGGLAARFLLQPMEETARLLWSRLQGDKGSNTLEESYVVLVKMVLYIGFTFGSLATNYTSVLLNILAGRKWGSNDEAIAVLSAFCLYTAFLAWNGMTEAFVFGVATSGGEIGRLGAMHSIVGVLFAAVAPPMVARYGTLGVVAANVAAMSLRSLYSMWFAATFFANRQNKDRSGGAITPLTLLSRLVGKMLPHGLVLFCFLVSGWVTNLSLQWLKSQDVPTGSMQWFKLALGHVGVGGVCFLITFVVAFRLEKDFRQSIRRLLSDKQD